MSKLIDRTGETKLNKFGTKMEIIKYNTARNIEVKFYDGYNTIVKCHYQQFNDGTLTSPYDKTYFGVGCKGITNTRLINSNKCVVTWENMLKRCYSENSLKLSPTYQKCSVCNEWKIFSNFEKWYNENYYSVNNEIMCLDKDILTKNNKIYSPQTCIFVPTTINILFCKANKIRGDLPLGVTWDTKNNRFMSCITEYNKFKFLGYFTNVNDAFLAYKTEKELYIKRIADKYRNEIPQKLYDALYNYEVEITD